MLKQYPRFEKGQTLKVYEKLPKKEQDTIKKYIDFCSATLTSKEKIEDVRRLVVQFRHITQKDFNKLDLQDLRDFLTLLNKSDRSVYNKNDIKVWIKKFLKWHFKDWSERFNNLEEVRTHKASNEEKINSKTLLKKEDIEKIMKQEKNIFWKAFFMTLYESGLRPIELRSLKWNDINFNVDNEMTELNIFATKTKRARVVFVKEATQYLKLLKEGSESIFVFPSPKDPNKPIHKSSVNMWFRNTGKKVLGRELFPYLLRHSRATELYKNAGIPDKIAQKFMGHSKNMSDVYTHLDSSDVKKAMRKTIYNFQKITAEQKQEFKKEIENLKLQLAVQGLTTHLFYDYHTGKISKKEFIKKMRELEKKAEKLGVKEI